MNKDIIKTFLIVFGLVVISLLFVFSRNFNSKPVEEIKEVSKVNREHFAMYVENKETGNYDKITNSIYFPGSDYVLNKDKSSCEDIEGENVDLNVIEFNEGKFKISSNKTLYCNLYFDNKKEAYALYTESDNTLTFVKSKTLITDTYNGKEVTSVYTDFEYTNWIVTELDGEISTNVPWESIKGNVNNVVFEDDIKPIDTKGWFANLSANAIIDVTNLDTSLVTDMSYMFYNNENQSIYGLSSLDTSLVSDMSYMFAYSSLSVDLDLRSWDVTKVSNYLGFAEECEGNTLYPPNFN